MDLVVAVGVEKNTIFKLVGATLGSPNQVMIVPPGQVSDFLVADRAEAILFFPQAKQLPPTLEVIHHLHAEAFFKVDFPLWVIRVGFAFDFSTPFNRRCRCGEQSNPVGLSAGAFLFSAKHPVPTAFRWEILVLNPAAAFLGMSSFCPAPQGLEDGMINFDKGALARSILMIVRPASNFGIEDGYQMTSGGLRIASDDLSDFRQKGFDILP